jgi:hypothetical protein
MIGYDHLSLMLYQSPLDFFRQPRIVPVKAPGTPLVPEPTDRMARQYQYMIRQIQKGENLHPTVRETIEIAHLLDVIKASAQSGRMMKV